MSVLVGRVGLVVKGAWDSSVAYAGMDVVTYNNSTYIAKQAVPAGTLPTNTTYWELSLDASLLQPKTMSSPVTIGGESKTTVEAAVGALENVKADKTAISSVETTSTAVAAHAVGSYFINANGQFVKTTTAIAIGDTIIVKPAVGYNCEQTTIGKVLASANSNISNILTDITNQELFTTNGDNTHSRRYYLFQIYSYYAQLTPAQQNRSYIIFNDMIYRYSSTYGGYFNVNLVANTGIRVYFIRLNNDQTQTYQLVAKLSSSNVEFTDISNNIVGDDDTIVFGINL